MALEGWEATTDRARNRLSQLSQQDKIAIALHDFASVQDPDVVEFDYADGPNGVRGHYGATAFPSMPAMAASFDRQLAAEYGVALAQETLAAGRPRPWLPPLSTRSTPCSIWTPTGGGAAGGLRHQRGDQCPGAAGPAARAARRRRSGRRAGARRHPGGRATSRWCWLAGYRARRWTSTHAACQVGRRRWSPQWPRPTRRTILVALSANHPVILPKAELAAVLHAWFPGEQFAEALADMLTGAAEPGGRLPITFPADEGRTPMETASQYPGVDGVTTYSDELLVGYRWYEERGVKPAFPFGHGMGYTTFEIDGLEAESTADGCWVRFALHNTGSRAGKAVPQIYVRYPPDVGEPGAQLKGFDAVRLEAGQRRVLTIDITYDDLMIFDEESGSRILAAGEYEVRAGFSSRDIRATAVVYLRQKSRR